MIGKIDFKLIFRFKDNGNWRFVLVLMGVYFFVFNILGLLLNILFVENRLLCLFVVDV